MLCTSPESEQSGHRGRSMKRFFEDKWRLAMRRFEDDRFEFCCELGLLAGFAGACLSAVVNGSYLSVVGG